MVETWQQALNKSEFKGVKGVAIIYQLGMWCMFHHSGSKRLT